MLVYLLAIASGSGSLALFLTAFFLPEIHRKGDFLWSGLGLFYALVLWITASRINGGLLLGEAAGVAVLIWAILQMLQTRWKLVPIEQRSAPSIELMAKIERLLSEESLQKIQTQVTNLVAKIKVPDLGKSASPSAPETPKVSEVSPESIPKSTPKSTPEMIVVVPEVTPEITPEVIVVIPEPTPEIPVEPNSNAGTGEDKSPPAEVVPPEVAVFKIPAPSSEPPPVNPEE